MPIEIEPDPEPEIPSPTHNIPRGPSPEAKPDDTECHRSQSAMYVKSQTDEQHPTNVN